MFRIDWKKVAKDLTVAEASVAPPSSGSGVPYTECCAQPRADLSRVSSSPGLMWDVSDGGIALGERDLLFMRLHIEVVLTVERYWDDWSNSEYQVLGRPRGAFSIARLIGEKDLLLELYDYFSVTRAETMEVWPTGQRQQAIRLPGTIVSSCGDSVESQGVIVAENVQGIFVPSSGMLRSLNNPNGLLPAEAAPWFPQPLLAERSQL